MTQEFLSCMLGVRRAGVSVVAGAPQAQGLIQQSRGRMAILDRAGLEAEACGCYWITGDSRRQIMGQGSTVRWQTLSYTEAHTTLFPLCSFEVCPCSRRRPALKVALYIEVHREAVRESQVGQAVWQSGPGGVLSCELGGLRLAVERASGWVRYTVHRHQGGAGGPGPTLIASGNKDDVRAAMQAAESVAEAYAEARQAGDAGAGRRGPARDHAA